MEDEKKRISLTKAQCNTDEGKELIALCLDLTEDGMLSDDEINRLQHLVTEKLHTDIFAFDHLNSAILLHFDNRASEYQDKKILYKAIEQVLPIVDRKKASGNRKALEAEIKVAERLRCQEEKQHIKNENQRNKNILSANFMVAGCKIDNRPQLIEKHVHINDDVILQRDKSNKFSKNAVKIFTKKGHHIGFVPEFYAEEVAQALDGNSKYEALCTKMLGYESPIPVVQIYFYRSDSDYGRPAISTNLQNGDTTINLAGPIILIALLALMYFIFKAII